MLPYFAYLSIFPAHLTRTIAGDGYGETEATQTGLNKQLSIQPVLSSCTSHPPPFAVAHFLGHLFLSLFQLLWGICISNGTNSHSIVQRASPRPAFCLWSLHLNVFCVHSGLLTSLRGSSTISDILRHTFRVLEKELTLLWRQRVVLSEVSCCC